MHIKRDISIWNLKTRLSVLSQVAGFSGRSKRVLMICLLSATIQISDLSRLKVGRYLTREIAEKNSWRPIVIKLGIQVPQGVLFDLSVTLVTLLLYSWRHERHNESRHFQTHARFTAAIFCDNGARKLKTIPGWPRNFPHFISSSQNVKYKKTMAGNVVFITKCAFSTSFLFSDRRCLTAYFTLTQIDGYFLIQIF